MFKWDKESRKFILPWPPRSAPVIWKTAVLWVLYLRNFLQLPFSFPLLQQELRRRVPWSSIRRGWSWNRSLPESRILEQEPESPPCRHYNPVCSCCSKARQQSLLWWAALRPSKAAQTIPFCQELECFFLSFFFYVMLGKRGSVSGLYGEPCFHKWFLSCSRHLAVTELTNAWKLFNKHGCL